MVITQYERGIAMMKIWVLESFVNADSQNNTVEEFKGFLADAVKESNEELIECLKKAIDHCEKFNLANPDGHWSGIMSKKNYKNFCYEAKDTMRRHKDWQFRVVKAEIEDNATTWVGYTNAVVNDGVLKYFYATM